MEENLEIEKVEKKELKEINFEKGVIPKDYSDVLRFAALIHGAGMAPKGFDTPAKVAVGILTNMEQGRPAVTGLQDLAIINGKCGTYGNAITAKITASGLMEKDYPIQTETGTPFEDDWTFTYTIKRKGRPKVTGKWTWAEAKVAGQADPKRRDGSKDMFSPWRRFPRRMMQWKARSFVNQDEFGDILRGMVPVEDLYDTVDLVSGKNGIYTISEQKEPKTKVTPDYTPKDLKTEDPAEDLKKKLDEGDKGIGGYNKLKGDPQTAGYMKAVKTDPSRTEDQEDSRQELDKHLMGGRLEQGDAYLNGIMEKDAKSTVDPLTGDALEQDEPTGILPDGVDPIAWLLTSRGKSSPENADRVMRVFKAEEKNVESQSDEIKAKLRRKYKDVRDYLANIEANKKDIAKEEPPLIETPLSDSGIQHFEQEQELNEANGRLKFLASMKRYKEKNPIQYGKVLSTLGFASMNDVKDNEKDHEVVLGFLKEEFKES